MTRSDPLLMLADIALLALVNPDLDEAVVRGIYQHQVSTSGRQPTLQGAPDGDARPPVRYHRTAERE